MEALFYCRLLFLYSNFDDRSNSVAWSGSVAEQMAAADSDANTVWLFDLDHADVSHFSLPELSQVARSRQTVVIRFSGRTRKKGVRVNGVRQ